MSDILHDVLNSPVLSGVIVAWITTCAALWMRQNFAVKNAKAAALGRCGRLEIALRTTDGALRNILQSLRFIAQSRKDNVTDDEFVTARLDELSKTQMPFHDLEHYLKTGEELRDEKIE